MTITDEQAVEWALEESKRNGSFHRWDEDRTRDFAVIIKLLSKPQLMDALKPARRERLIWNLPSIYRDTERRGEYRTQRIELAAGVPDAFAHVYGDAIESSTSLEMFWDIAIEGIANGDRPLLDTVFDALVRQLAIPNVWCQSSAIHGFNHLKEPRCRTILRSFIENCGDESLREYARGAMTFTLM